MIHLVASILSLLSFQAPQNQVPVKCDMRRVEKGYWCEKCDKTFEKDKLVAGKCPACTAKAAIIEMCVKKYYACCRKSSPKKGDCAACKKPMEEKVDKCRILYTCEGCGVTHPIAARLQHNLIWDKQPGTKANVVRRCQREGIDPHKSP